MYPSAVRKLNENEEKEAVQNTGKLGPGAQRYHQQEQDCINYLATYYCSRFKRCNPTFQVE
jgi:hypothetical protein